MRDSYRSSLEPLRSTTGLRRRQDAECTTYAHAYINASRRIIIVYRRAHTVHLHLLFISHVAISYVAVAAATSARNLLIAVYRTWRTDGCSACFCGPAGETGVSANASRYVQEYTYLSGSMLPREGNVIPKNFRGDFDRCFAPFSTSVNICISEFVRFSRP